MTVEKRAERFVEVAESREARPFSVMAFDPLRVQLKALFGVAQREQELGFFASLRKQREARRRAVGEDRRLRRVESYARVVALHRVAPRLADVQGVAGLLVRASLVRRGRVGRERRRRENLGGRTRPRRRAHRRGRTSRTRRDATGRRGGTETCRAVPAREGGGRSCGAGTVASARSERGRARARSKAARADTTARGGECRGRRDGRWVRRG